MKIWKVVAVLLVAGFAVYHSILHATYGVTPCKGLLKDGMYKVAGSLLAYGKK